MGVFSFTVHSIPSWKAEMDICIAPQIVNVCKGKNSNFPAANPGTHTWALGNTTNNKHPHMTHWEGLTTSGVYTSQ